jgi:hypothetical protein
MIVCPAQPGLHDQSILKSQAQPGLRDVIGFWSISWQVSTYLNRK